MRIASLHIEEVLTAPYSLENPYAERLIGSPHGNAYSSFEAPVQSYAIVTDSPALNIAPSNHAGIVRNDPAFADGKHVLET